MFGDLLKVRAVRARSEYRRSAKDASNDRVRARKRSAYRLKSRHEVPMSFYFYYEWRKFMWAYVVHECDTFDLQMLAVKRERRLC